MKGLAKLVAPLSAKKSNSGRQVFFLCTTHAQWNTENVKGLDLAMAQEVIAFTIDIVTVETESVQIFQLDLQQIVTSNN